MRDINHAYQEHKKFMREQETIIEEHVKQIKMFEEMSRSGSGEVATFVTGVALTGARINNVVVSQSGLQSAAKQFAGRNIKIDIDHRTRPASKNYSDDARFVGRVVDSWVENNKVKVKLMLDETLPKDVLDDIKKKIETKMIDGFSANFLTTPDQYINRADKYGAVYKEVLDLTVKSLALTGDPADTNCKIS